MTTTDAQAPNGGLSRELTKSRARKILAERFGFDDFQYRQFEPIQQILCVERDDKAVLDQQHILAAQEVGHWRRLDLGRTR